MLNLLYRHLNHRSITLWFSWSEGEEMRELISTTDEDDEVQDQDRWEWIALSLSMIRKLTSSASSSLLIFALRFPHLFFRSLFLLFRDLWREWWIESEKREEDEREAAIEKNRMEGGWGVLNVVLERSGWRVGGEKEMMEDGEERTDTEDERIRERSEYSIESNDSDGTIEWISSPKKDSKTESLSGEKRLVGSSIFPIFRMHP